MREPDHSKHVALADWVDPDPDWQKAWARRRQVIPAGIALMAAAVTLAALDPLVPLPLTPVGIACVVVSIVALLGIPVCRIIRWRFRDTWFMSESWRTEWGPLLFGALIVAALVFSVVALIVRIVTGDPTLNGHTATVGLLDSASRRR